MSLKSIPVLIQSTSDAPILLTSKTPAICKISGTKVQLRKPGICLINHEQEANERFFSASQMFSFGVLPNKTITCQKGSTIRKVVGTNPKCPPGFKQKR
jgi:hypothetical protein